jgi:hypothetical protein
VSEKAQSSRVLEGREFCATNRDRAARDGRSKQRPYEYKRKIADFEEAKLKGKAASSRRTP